MRPLVQASSLQVERNLPHTTSNQASVDRKLILFRAGRPMQDWYLTYFLHDEMDQLLEQIALVLSHYRTYCS